MQSEMAVAQGVTDALERTSQGELQESPQKEGPSATLDEQAEKQAEEGKVDKHLDSP